MRGKHSSHGRHTLAVAGNSLEVACKARWCSPGAPLYRKKLRFMYFEFRCSMVRGSIFLSGFRCVGFISPPAGTCHGSTSCFVVASGGALV